jgi:hypothetical protein
MNWQAVIDQLRHESSDLQWRTAGLSAGSEAMVLANAYLLKALADSLQMGLNKGGDDEQA